MRFLFSRDLRDQPHIRLALFFYLICIACFWALNWPYEAQSFGVYPSDISLKILGSPQVFAAPMSLEVLLLNIHVRLFLYTLSLLTLSAIYFRMPSSERQQTIITSSAYVFLLMNMMSVVLIRFVSPFFIWPKVIGFWGLQLTLGWMLFQGLYFILTPKAPKVLSR